MFVPRAVTRKPVTRPTQPKSLRQSQKEPSGSPGCQNPKQDSRNSSPGLVIPETGTCASVKECKVNKATNDTFQQNITESSSSGLPRVTAESLLSDCDTRPTPTLPSKKSDTACSNQVFTPATEASSKAKCKIGSQTSQDLDVASNDGSHVGVRGGIKSHSVIDIASIRRSVDLDDASNNGSKVGVRGGIKPHSVIDIASIRRSMDLLKERMPKSSVTSSDMKADEGTQDEKDNLADEENTIDDEGENEEEEVVSYSKNQRWRTGDDEPVCVMCGRYGAYICDQTEADVCSRECKARNLARLSKTSGLVQTSQQDDELETDGTVESEVFGYVYKEHNEVAELTREQVQEIRSQVDIFVEGIDIPRPIIEFSHLSTPKKMECNLASVGYTTPTPVQMQVIPAALRWRDVMVCAQTSSGKTAAFLVPTILQIYNCMCFRESKDEGQGPLGLILTPSRELAMQIEDQAKQLMQGLPNMRTALVVGGVPMPTQLHRLKQDIQLVIATPGRILDVISREGISFASIKTVIIDEMDTMLCKGFQEQVMQVMSQLPDSHQTLLFSATIPPSIEKMAASLLCNPLYISVGKPNTPCTSVKQIMMWVEEPAKKKNLFAILQDPKHYRPPLVVFVDSKIGAGLLSLAIHKMCGIHAISLHGDRPQNERTETLKCFREGEYPVLVCTAILGRGIDLPGVKMVVNFDMPNSVEEYIHQIGRTGRLGSRGTAITFINNGSKNLFLEFVNTLRPLGVPLPPQLTNSAHLRYQQQGHQSWQKRRKARDEDDEADGRHGNTSYFGYKRRKQEKSVVGELLKKRKHKSEVR